MIRIGVDFGGTKIEAAALDADGRFLARVRGASPRTYEAGLEAVRELVAEAERQAGASAAQIGVCGPGSPSPATGLMRNANSTELNGHPFPQDLAQVLSRPVRYANDANCLALSEATDGAGAGDHVVFAAILGTGCGAGIAEGGQVLEGRNAFAGEWGHMPLPWPTGDEHPGPACARAGDARAAAALDRYVDRLARGLAVVCDVIDPDVIVLGGGLSNLAELYERLPGAIAPKVFSDVFTTPVRPALHGDSSGVRGAAWLWPAP